MFNTQYFIERAIKVHGNKYDYSKSIYKGSHKKITIICKIHDEFDQIAGDHLSGHKCNKCGKSNKLTTQQFIERAIKVYGNKYDYSKVNYINCNTKVCIICPIHGEFWQRPLEHLKHECKQCGNDVYNKQRIFTTLQFVERAIKVHGNKYDYSKSNYVHNKKKVTIKCNKCNNYFNQVAITHLSGHGCPICGESHGEKLIREFLINNKINFIQEKLFIDLRGAGGGFLRFDFYLPGYNILIEFDGKQHFNRKYCEKYYGKERVNYYNTLKIHDHKKSRYCKKQGIKLIRIPYYNILKIQEILKNQDLVR
jgi:hypothetical protein